MRDKFGRPKLLGYTDQVDMKKKGYFFQPTMLDPRTSMRSGTEQYHAMILCLQAHQGSLKYPQSS